MRIVLELADVTIDAYPVEVADALRALEALAALSPGPGPSALDAAAVAERFGVSRAWVYEHAEELGALRLGGGSRPRLRFDPVRVEAALSRRRDRSSLDAEVPAPAANRPRRRRHRSGSEVELLPVGRRKA
jgi:hypothetical protein